MPLKFFKTPFPQSPIDALCTTKNNAVVLKIYIESNIEQLGVCAVKFRHKIKFPKCRFPVVPGDGPALLGKPDIEVLGVLKITCGSCSWSTGRQEV